VNLHVQTTALGEGMQRRPTRAKPMLLLRYSAHIAHPWPITRFALRHTLVYEPPLARYARAFTILLAALQVAFLLQLAAQPPSTTSHTHLATNRKPGVGRHEARVLQPNAEQCFQGSPCCCVTTQHVWGVQHLDCNLFEGLIEG